MTVDLEHKKVKADLHTHTNFSDGILSPEELVEKALKKNINILSITDHDNVSAIEVALKAGKKHDIEIVPGIELSADFQGKEVHILAYFIDYKNKILKDYLENFREIRINRIKEMLKILKTEGIDLTYNDVLKSSEINGKASIGRPHLAKALMNEKHVKTIGEAFMKYIGDDKPAYVKKQNPSLKEVFHLINSIGGLSFLAHPGRTFRDVELGEFLDAGLDGIEVLHPSHSKDDAKYYSELASQFFLLESGGSDYHGISSNDNLNFGKYCIPANYIINMKRRLF
jgi:predicted metal-dependent phosphoesterase TrpH